MIGIATFRAALGGGFGRGGATSRAGPWPARSCVPAGRCRPVRSRAVAGRISAKSTGWGVPVDFVRFEIVPDSDLTGRHRPIHCAAPPETPGREVRTQPDPHVWNVKTGPTRRREQGSRGDRPWPVAPGVRSGSPERPPVRRSGRFRQDRVGTRRRARTGSVSAPPAGLPERILSTGPRPRRTVRRRVDDGRTRSCCDRQDGVPVATGCDMSAAVVLGLVTVAVA